MCKFVVDINLVGAELKPSPGRPASPVVVVGRGLSGKGEGEKDFVVCEDGVFNFIP